MTAANESTFVLDRMAQAVEKLRERLLRTARTLDAAGIPYAVIGDNAVSAWVSRVDDALVRFAKDIEILVRPEDLDAAEAALSSVGIHHGKVADAIHVILAGQKVRPEYLFPAPDVDERERGQDYYVLNLDALIRMKLTSNRDHDRTHIRDMISAGLINQTWVSRVPSELAERLQHCLDTPDG